MVTTSTTDGQSALRLILVILPGAIPFEVNQAEDCPQND